MISQRRGKRRPFRVNHRDVMFRNCICTVRKIILASPRLSLVYLEVLSSYRSNSFDTCTKNFLPHSLFLSLYFSRIGYSPSCYSPIATLRATPRATRVCGVLDVTLPLYLLHLKLHEPKSRTLGLVNLQ